MARPSSNPHPHGWADILCCCNCNQLFGRDRLPINLNSGVVCLNCIRESTKIHSDNLKLPKDVERYPVNVALLKILGVHTSCLEPLTLTGRFKSSPLAKGSHEVEEVLTDLSAYFRHPKSESSSTISSDSLSRLVQRRLIAVLTAQLYTDEGRANGVRLARALAERIITELILNHQSSIHVSSYLWSAVRSRGCQFLGPAMQEDVLRLILLALQKGELIARKTLVLYIVQTMSDDYPHVSKTCVGHVVQLLYRASCFNVIKRDGESSLMQLKTEFRDYDRLRHEHDTQIVQIALEAGLRISAEQWSSLLYGDTTYRNHMEGIMDSLTAPQLLAQSVMELKGLVAKMGDSDQFDEILPSLNGVVSAEVEDSCRGFDVLANVLISLRDILRYYVRCTKSKNFDSRSQRKAETKVNAAPVNGQRMYKTRFCRDVMSGRHCPRGDRCTYAHSNGELRANAKANGDVDFQPNGAGAFGDAVGIAAPLDEYGQPMPQPDYERSAFMAEAAAAVGAQPPPPPVQPLIPLMPVMINPAQAMVDPSMSGARNSVYVFPTNANGPPVPTNGPNDTVAPVPLFVPKAAPAPPPPAVFIPINQQAPITVVPQQPAFFPPPPQRIWFDGSSNADSLSLSNGKQSAPTKMPFPGYGAAVAPPQRITDSNGFSSSSSAGQNSNGAWDSGDEEMLLMRRHEIVSRLAQMRIDPLIDSEEDVINHVSYTVASSVLFDELDSTPGTTTNIELPPLPAVHALPFNYPDSAMPTRSLATTIADLARYTNAATTASATVASPPSAATVATVMSPVTTSMPMWSSVRTACPTAFMHTETTAPATVQADCSIMNTTDMFEGPLVISSIQRNNFSPQASYEAVDPSHFLEHVPQIIRPLPLSANPQRIVSTTLDRILTVKERIFDVNMKGGPGSAVEKAQLNVELGIVKRQISTLDKQTEQSCLLKELEAVDRKIEDMNVSIEMQQQPAGLSV